MWRLASWVPLNAEFNGPQSGWHKPSAGMAGAARRPVRSLPGQRHPETMATSPERKILTIT